MGPMLCRMAADPAPGVLALRAIHVVATHVLFYRHLAIRTRVCPNVVGPSLVRLLLGLQTSFPFVPRHLASVTDGLSTGRALHLGRGFPSFDNGLAPRVRAELLVRASSYFISVHKALELIEAVGAHD